MNSRTNLLIGTLRITIFILRSGLPPVTCTAIEHPLASPLLNLRLATIPASATFPVGRGNCYFRDDSCEGEGAKDNEVRRESIEEEESLTGREEAGS